MPFCQSACQPLPLCFDSRMEFFTTKKKSETKSEKKLEKTEKKTEKKSDKSVKKTEKKTEKPEKAKKSKAGKA